jgi:hypothetical protein
MFNDWQIHHFHLGRLFVTPEIVRRSGDELFAYISADEAILLGVFPHRSWTSHEVLEAFIDVAPRKFDTFEMRGILGSECNFTADEMYNLREKHTNCFFTLRGMAFCSPGFGLTSAGHATRLVVYVDQLQLAIKQTAKSAKTNSLSLKLTRQIAQSIDLPVRLGLRYWAGQLILVDKSRNLDLVKMRCLE